MNPDREVVFEAGGKSYRLVFGNRALRLVEKQLGRSFTEIDEGSINDLTVLIWAGLQRYQPELGIEDVDDLIDEVGYAALGSLVEKAMSAALPEGAGDLGNRAARRARANGAGGIGANTSGRR